MMSFRGQDLKKVCHITTVHNPFDSRIFHKECRTLALAGYDVVLIAPGPANKAVRGTGCHDGIRIVSPGQAGNRIKRMFFLTWKAYMAASAENADIYHFHDPEFLPWALMLKRKTGKNVIYDIHEDYITSIRQKKYLPSPVRRVLSGIFHYVERYFEKYFIKILAEKYYVERFPSGRVLLNYAVSRHKTPGCYQGMRLEGKYRLLYTGNISIDRGALIHARIAGLVPNVHVYMAGRCHKDAAEFVYSTASSCGRLHLECDGFVNHEKILAYYNEKWLAALAVFPTTEHYCRKELTKIFEYMGAGIPIIASNFKAWRKLIEGEGCGICVNPSEPGEISEAIEYLIRNPLARKKMGDNGRKAVLEKYNWEAEGKKLLRIYQELFDSGRLSSSRPLETHQSIHLNSGVHPRVAD